MIKKKRNITKLNLILIYLFNSLFIIGYIDFCILSPMILPEDSCYYHTNKIPVWIELFFLDSSEHTEPPFTSYHILVLLFVCLISTFFLYKKTTKNYS